jgi:hypothetical protein
MFVAHGWRIVLEVRAQIVDKFQEVLSRARGNFEQQNKVLEVSIIIINCCIIIIIIINAY